MAPVRSAVAVFASLLIAAPLAAQTRLSPIEQRLRDTILAAPPGYEADPYEMSVEELQRILDAAAPRRAPKSKSPFKD